MEGSTRYRRTLIRHLRAIGALAGILILSGAIAPLAAGTTVIDMTTAGATRTYDGVIFQQGPLPSSAGTGVLDPFIRIGANKDVTQGYNTNYRYNGNKTQYDEDPPWTEALLLSTVPLREVGGELYRVFYLDINQVNSVPDLSLDQLKLFLGSSPTLHDYDPVGETFAGGTALKVFDLGDAWVHLNYALEAGSGDSDMTMLVPESVFDPAGPSCDYGQSGCAYWLYAWNRFGEQFANNDGFEEWSTEVLPFIQLQKTAIGTFERTYDWDIDKTGTPTTHNLFAGGSADTDYDIPVDLTIDDGNILVTGTISITVPAKLPDGDKNAPDATVTSLTDMLSQPGPIETAGSISSSCTVPFTVKAGTTKTCTYTVTPAAAVGGTNTVTALVTDNPAPFEYSTGVTFSETTLGYPTIHVTDRFGDGSPYPLGSASADTTFADSRTFTCSTDPKAYTDGFYSYQVTNRAQITETGAYADETVTVNCYAPVVSKTAAGTYDERHEWEVTKTVDPLSQSAFAGDTVGFDWTITVDESVFEENFDVAGVISVVNPAPMPMVVGLTDLLGDGTSATIMADADCAYLAGSLTIPADSTATCPYAAPDLAYSDDAAAPTLNTATATLGGLSVSASHAIAWVPNVIRGTATLDDDQFPYAGQPVTDGWTKTYADSYTCSTDFEDYPNGSSDLGNQVVNTAEVWSGGSLQDSSTATTTIDCYMPQMSKTAVGTYGERHEWAVDKTVDPESQAGFAGETLDFDWTVNVTETVAAENFDVSGVIHVNNPNPEDTLVVALSDKLSDGTVATIVAGAGCAYAGGNLTIPAGTMATCPYMANDLAYTDVTKAPTDNFATATLNGIQFGAVATIAWTPTITGATATVTDDQKPLDETISDSATFTYADSYTCSSNPADYAGDGTYRHTESNTAVVTWGTAGEDSDDATETIDCYAPVVSKTADGTYDREWDWTIDKTADQTSLTLAAGQTFEVNYEVVVTATKTELGYEVAGVISVHNPHPSASMDVTVADAIGATSATIDCGTGAGDTTLTVAHGTTGTCSYVVDFGSTKPSETVNTATVTFNKIDFTASQGFGWKLGEETDECITVSDTKYGSLGTVCASDSPETLTYKLLIGPFEVCGPYEYPNTASFVTNDTGATGSDSWNVLIDVPCEGCTLTQGYWKTHSEFGPAPYDDTWELLDALEGSGTPVNWAGDGSYQGASEMFFSPKTSMTWYEVFWTAPAGNSYYQLAHQYEAAVLNILNEASAPTTVTAAIAHAESLFEQWTPEQIGALKGNNAIRKDFIATAGVLASYNEGKTGPGHCDEDRSSSSAP